MIDESICPRERGHIGHGDRFLSSGQTQGAAPCLSPVELSRDRFGAQQ